MKEGSKAPVDMEYLGTHGHLKMEDAQSMHVACSRHHGITDPDVIVADWNQRDPEAPWGSGIVGTYVRELSNLCFAFMANKVHEAAGVSTESPLFTFLRFNAIRAGRGKEAAQVEATWPDGEVEVLWMDEGHILANIVEHGSQKGLLEALHAYAQNQGQEAGA